MENASDTVLLVCSDGDKAAYILERLADEGFNAIGPVATAAMALALAASSAPSVAIIAKRPTGRRNTAELAGELMQTWGVRSLLLNGAFDECPDAPVDRSSAPRPGQIERLRRALGDLAVAGNYY